MALDLALSGMKRGFMHRCPECGEGRLFRKYLKVQASCEACGHDNAQYPADDAPPYFTILLVGHLVIAPVLFFEQMMKWPAIYVLAVSLPLLAIITLVLLPHVKGAVIGLQWALREGHKRAHGEDPAPPAV